MIRSSSAGISGADAPEVSATGFGSALPERVVASAEVEAAVRTASPGFPLPRGLIERVSGIQSRRWRGVGENASDLAARAGRQAMEMAGLQAVDVDVLIFAAASQDVAEPATANIVQDLLGCEAAYCLDVKNACNSFLNGLDIAQSMIQTRRARTVLVAAGEVISPAIDFTIRSSSDMERKFAGLTLGDAGGAMVVRAASVGSGSRLYPGSFVSDGRQWRTSMIHDGGSRGWSGRPTFECDSPSLLALAQRHLPLTVKRTLESVQWTMADVDFVVPHQVSAGAINQLAAAVGVERERVFTTLEHAGNTAAASIPLTLAHAVEDGAIATGDRGLLLACAGGFSVGCIPLVL